MRDGLFATSAVLALTNLGVGWYLGYRSVGTYLLFWASAAFVALTAVRLVRRVFPAGALSDTLIRVGIVSFAIIVLSGLVLGSAGLLSPMAYLVVFLALFALSRLTSAPSTLPLLDRWPAVPLPIVAVVVPVLAFIVAVGIIESPLTLYDSLSYHLFFPARWIQEQRLSIVPTPFGDPAQAYQPANGELFFLWLMLPFHGDLVARIGQFPFLLLTGIALFAIARRIGARPEHAVYAPAFYFLARPIVEQAVGADVDLICSATFVTSLYLGILAVDTNERRDWALWGVSVGLYWGSKYLALVYTPVFLLLAVVRGPRLNTLWALPGIAVLALPWYVRNWAMAGSPIYPATVKVAGITLAPGAFTREAMNNSVFHTTDFRLFPVIVSHAFGTPLFLFWMPFALLGAAAILTRPRGWPGGYVLLVPALMIPLYWFGLPDNIDSRFFLPAVAVAMVPLAFVFGTNEKWNACVHGLYLAGMLWILVGMNSDIRASLPWYMEGWLSLRGLVNVRSFVWFVGLAAAAGISWRLTARAPDRRIPIIVGVAALGSAVVAIGSDVRCAPSRCELLQLSSPYIRSTMLNGWDWVMHNTRDVTFAYTGNNVPYPLFGEQLRNRVYYVNIDRHLSWRFHDYAHARSRPGAAWPSSPLARSSGELMPARQPPGPSADESRPRYERIEGYRDAWLQNLSALGVDYLFVSALSAYEIDDVWHNTKGFPIEDEWAHGDPATFTLAYDNPDIRIYAVRRTLGERRP